MAETRDIIFRLLGDSKSLERATRKSEGALGNMVGALKRVATFAAVAFGAREAVQWAADGIELAKAAEEIDSKFEAVFGTATDLTQALSEWGDRAGVTESEAKDLAAEFGNLAQAQGISKDATKDLVEDVATLAGDLASFNDDDPEQVFQDLNRALLTTEREGMKKYGIAISENEVKQRALEIATEDGRDEVTKADRAYASYKIALEQAGAASGDLARTQDSTANKERQLKAAFKETQEELGQRLLPIYDDLIDISSDLLPILGDTFDNVGDLVGAFGDLTGVLSGVTGGIGDTDEGFFGFLGTVNEWAQKTNPLWWGLEKFRDATLEIGDAFKSDEDRLKDLSAAMDETPWPTFMDNVYDTVDAQKDLNEALADSIDFFGRMEGALQGDLFKDYREQLAETIRLQETLGVLGGGRANPDYDRGEDYTNASTVYNRTNGYG